ncbi:hypothetical protein JVU11DRAFT_7943 [Chiua virens]|nr:hypothetical protein JVU11DRAFT_7943 [Chiua virens]
MPSFVDIRELKNHVSEAHSNVPHNPAGHPPRQPVPATQCCICNKKFASPDGLSAHRRAKQHYPPRSPSPRKSMSPEELDRQPTAPGGPFPIFCCSERQCDCRPAERSPARACSTPLPRVPSKLSLSCRARKASLFPRKYSMLKVQLLIVYPFRVE